MTSYIRVKSSGITDEEGAKINISNVQGFEFSKGVDTNDLSVVSTGTRVLLATSGIKEDYNFTFDLIDDRTNKAYNIDNIGNEISAVKISTAEQLLFLLKNVILKDITAVYLVYIDWLDTEYVGQLTIRGRTDQNDYFSTVTFSAQLKVGANILGA